MKPGIDTVLVLNEVGQKVPMKLLTPLYTADQLRQAKMEVLREAATGYGHEFHNSDPVDYLTRMADELEKGV